MSATRLSPLKTHPRSPPDESMDVTIELDSAQDMAQDILSHSTVVTMEFPEDSEDKQRDATWVNRKSAVESPVPHNSNEATAVAANEVLELAKMALSDIAAVETSAKNNTVPIEKVKEDNQIKKGDDIKALYEVRDMFDVLRTEWYFGTVIDVKPKSIRVQYDETNIKTYRYPCDDIAKLETSIKDSPEKYYPEIFCVGDVVDAKFRDETTWYRGRVAHVSQDGKYCNIIYYDQELELDIPTTGKKLRLCERYEPSGIWLMGKPALLIDGTDFRTGTVSKKLGSTFQITVSDGSSVSGSYDDVAKAVFEYFLKDVTDSKRHEWPGSMRASRTERNRIRRQRREEKKAIDEWFGQAKKREVKAEKKPEIKSEKKPDISARTRSLSRSDTSNNAVKAEPIDTPDEADTSKHDNAECLDIQGLSLEGPAVSMSVLEKRKTAKDFPPGLNNVLWCALNSPEAQTGANFLRDLLCVHDSVPPSTMVQKLMELAKFGPKAEGSSVYFKDPHRIELASEYVCGLVSASSRLVRQDSYALFGPSSWDDIKVLLLQSIVETENMISGRRLAQGLQLAARGAKLLSLMLTTELQGHNLYFTSSVTLDSQSLKGMPTVQSLKSYGVRSGLNAAVRHTTKCLVRHSRWVMDQGDLDSTTGRRSASMSDECCALEARACLDSLGSTVCVIAWLFCVEERIELVDPSVAFVIKDAFLAELERCLEHFPEMNERNKGKFVKKLKMYFLLSLVEDFCTPIVVSLGSMIGVEDELSLVGLVK